jgi:hypothetical protein
MIVSNSTMIFHSSDFDLKRYVTGQLATEDAAVVQAHLEQCEECQLRLADIALQAQWKDTEQRIEPRVPVNLVGRLKLLDPVTSVGPPHDVRVVEISRGGLKVRTPRFLIPKTLVQIVFDGKPVLGEVRYCVKVDSEYQAGIKQIQNFPGAS